VEDNTGFRLGAGITKSWWWNFNDPASDLNTLHSLDPDVNSPSIDLAQFSLMRESKDWMPGMGLKVDVGRIARRIKADWDGSGSIWQGSFERGKDIEVQDAYLDWSVPEGNGPLSGLTLKGGKFVTLLGAEVIEPWANYNYSRSFLFGYAIPFTHTGGLITYPFTDKLSATGGVVVGWDNVQDNNNVPSGIGNITYVFNDMFTLSANGIVGAEQTSRDSPKREVGDLVGTIKPTDKFTIVLNYDYGHESDVTARSRPATWQGFAAVFNYDWTCRFSTAVRGEWFEDAKGVRTGTKQDLWETTATLKYLITQHLFGQIEYRHDGSDKDVFEERKTSVIKSQDIIGFAFTYLFE
jgi:hypothetical protein